MALPLILGVAALTGGAFGGLLFWSSRNARLKTGDVALVPAGKVTPGASVGGVKMPALGGIDDLVRVEAVTRAPGADVATGTAGKELGLALPVAFAVADVATIERKGVPHQNPERR